jgi:hypothetical protein
LNAAYCLVVLRGLVFCVFSAIDSQTTLFKLKKQRETRKARMACEATNSAGIQSTITSEPVEHFEEKYTGGPNQNNIFSHELAQVLSIIMKAKGWLSYSIKNIL